MPFKEIYALQYKLEDINNTAAKIIDLLEIKEGKIVIFLGEPGAGKSTLCNALINLLEGEVPVTQSPTFTKVQEYKRVSHMDLYMMNKSNQYMDYLTNFQNKILFIEWGMEFIKYLKADFLVEITPLDEIGCDYRSVILSKVLT